MGSMKICVNIKYLYYSIKCIITNWNQRTTYVNIYVTYCFSPFFSLYFVEREDEESPNGKKPEGESSIGYIYE